MKVFKYITVSLASMLVANLYADYSAALSETDTGHKVVVTGEPSSDASDTLSALNESEKSINSSLGDLNATYGSALRAAMSSIKTQAKTSNLSAPKGIDADFASNPDGSVSSKVNTDFGNVKVSANARTTTDANGNSKTDGTLEITPEGLSTTSIPLSVSTDSKGNVVGTVGQQAVEDLAEVEENPAKAVANSSQTTANANSDDVVPDSTLVSSGTR